jgi:O-methyltransferase involved in polyketide biosynthesis
MVSVDAGNDGGTTDRARNRTSLVIAAEAQDHNQRWGHPMDQKKPSQTAIQTAMRRAAHFLLDAEPKILSDTFARAFAGFACDQALLKAFVDLPLADQPSMRTQFVVRNRYAEDELDGAAARGIRQYVILGAGLDSFAWRRPDHLKSVHVFEVDHPASQAWKRQRIADLRMETPTTLHYVPIWISFFEPNQLRDRLLAMNYEAVTLFGPEQASARYLNDRTDGMRLPAYFHMIKAHIGKALP